MDVRLTGLSSEERFANHKAEIKVASVMTRCGLRLLSELCAHLKPPPYDAKAKMEVDLAEDLCRAWDTVMGRHG